MDRIRRIVDVAGALKDELDEGGEGDGRVAGTRIEAEHLSLSPATG